jgi:hypothetical protein
MAEHAVMNGIRGEVRLNESLAGYTSWRVGGPADRLFKPADLDDLCTFMSMLPANEPVTWIGLGSNLLVRDGGVRGSVVAMQGQLTDIDMLENEQVRIQAGVSCAKAARQCARAGLVGLEFDHPLGHDSEDSSQLVFHWRVAYTAFGKNIVFTRNSMSTQVIDDQWELGAAVGRRGEPLRIWFLRFDRLGLGYRSSSSGDLKGVTFFFRSLFDE